MEIGKQIRKYRTSQKWSQDDLADRIFVTRQTISNWENDRNYPDIRSLVLLSTVFGISLDILVKGDLDEMKEQIRMEDIRKFRRDSRVYALLLAGTILLPLPMLKVLRELGIWLWLGWYGITVYWACRVEKQQRMHDIYTFREIMAFLDGKRLDELQIQREIGKRRSLNAYYEKYGPEYFLKNVKSIFEADDDRNALSVHIQRIVCAVDQQQIVSFAV